MEICLAKFRLSKDLNCPHNPMGASNKFLKVEKQLRVGSGQETVNYTGTQSFITRIGTCIKS